VRSFWRPILNTIAASRAADESNELFVAPDPGIYSNTEFIDRTAALATQRLFIASAIVLAFTALAFATRFHRAVAFGLIVLAAGELLWFGRKTVATTSPNLQLPQPWLDALARGPNDARVLVVNPLYANAGMYFGFDNLWGYDPGVLKRYAEVLTVSQGGRAQDAKQYLQFTRPDRNIFRMLRCRYIFLDDPKQPPVVPMPEPLPTAVLIRNYTVSRDRDQILSTLQRDDFDPRSAVLLESEPDPRTEKGATIGTAEVLRRESDELELRVDIDTPAMLLVTNNYARGWRVRPVGPAPQPDYEIQPANWSLPAIALRAGRHHFVLEYLPASFIAGKWITVVSLTALVLFPVAVQVRKRAARA
jgi:hypothetical protein